MTTSRSLRLGPVLRRREFLKSAAGTGLVLAGWSGVSAAPRPRRLSECVDVNVNLSHWPLRRLALDDPAALVTRLRAQGVTEAWAGSFDGLLHKDLTSANTRLAEQCRRHGRGLLRPFGSVNPAAPDWQEELRRCVSHHRMAGIRVHPNYHGYGLDSPAFAQLLKAATDLRLVVQLALVMEDERMMHPRLRVEPVDPAPLAGIVKETPRLRLILLNALRTLRGAALTELIGAGQIWVEIAMLEGVGGVESLLRQVPAERVLFGSHAPLFYFEAAALKLEESRLAPGSLQAIRSANARQVLSARS